MRINSAAKFRGAKYPTVPPERTKAFRSYRAATRRSFTVLICLSSHGHGPNGVRVTSRFSVWTTLVPGGVGGRRYGAPTEIE
jgi:hypothetical protein